MALALTRSGERGRSGAEGDFMAAVGVDEMASAILNVKRLQN